MAKRPGAPREWELREIRSSRLLKSAYAFKYRSQTSTRVRARDHLVPVLAARLFAKTRGKSSSN